MLKSGGIAYLQTPLLIGMGLCMSSCKNTFPIVKLLSEGMKLINSCKLKGNYFGNTLIDLKTSYLNVLTVV